MKGLKRAVQCLISSAASFILALPAWAAVGGIAERTAEEASSRVVQLLNDVLRPFGALIIFVAVAYTGFKMVMTAHRPEERAQTLASIPYILGGAIVIGGVMIFAGFIVQLMLRAGQ
jgi:Na+/serine symporter